MMVDKLCGIEGSSSSRGLLASIENIDISRLKPKHQGQKHSECGPVIRVLQDLENSKAEAEDQ